MLKSSIKDGIKDSETDAYNLIVRTNNLFRIV